MPHATEEEALNRPFLDLDSIAGSIDGAAWRAVLVGTPAMRAVLLRWPAGYASVPHFHPGAEEVFLIISGRAAFTIGDEPEREVGPGDFMLAKRGEIHAIRVPDGASLTLLAAVAPNTARPDETIEPGHA